MSSRPPSGITNVPSPMGAPYADYHGAWFDVTFQGLSELVNRFGLADQVVKDELTRAIQAVSKQGVTLAVNLVNARRKPFDSGQLAGSIKVLPVKISSTTIEGGYGTSLFYAYFVERGRGWVFPIRARMLSWIDRSSGKRVFAMSARPSSPKPFMEPSSRQLGPIADREFAKAAAAIVAVLKG